jgi:hypothetical protein
LSGIRLGIRLASRTSYGQLFRACNIRFLVSPLSLIYLSRPPERTPMYTIRETERETLISWIDRALDMNPPLHSICVDRKVGRSTSQQGEIQSDELAVLAAQAGSGGILEEILSRWGIHGGRWQIRLMIDSGEGEPKKQLKRSFDMIKQRPAEASKSRGSAAGVEELTRAWADGFSAQIESQQAAQTATHNTMMAMLQQQQDTSLVRLQESVAYQSQIDNLRQQLTAAQIEMAVADQQSVWTPEMLQSILPGVLGLLQAAANRLMPGAIPDAVPGAPPPEDSPS